MQQKVNYIDQATFENMLVHIPELNIRKWLDDDVRMLFRLCYFCGLRMNEAIRLKKEDFDLAKNEVFLGTTKTHKNDFATIPPSFMVELSEYLYTKKEGELFPGLNYNIVYNWLARLGKMLDIPALTTPESVSGEKTKTHIFRKSIGKEMIFGTLDGRKAPLNIVMDKLRHNDLVTTSKYLKLGKEGVKDWEGQDEIKL